MEDKNKTNLKNQTEKQETRWMRTIQDKTTKEGNGTTAEKNTKTQQNSHAEQTKINNCSEQQSDCYRDTV